MRMKIKDLQKALEDMDPLADVIVVSDPEGNDSHFLGEAQFEPGERAVVLWPGEHYER